MNFLLRDIATPPFRLKVELRSTLKGTAELEQIPHNKDETLSSLTPVRAGLSN
jgi:hypothetical protein